MKRNDNLPLNVIERMNARVSMIVAVIVLAILCIVFNRMDYYMVRKPAEEASKAADQIRKEEESEQAEETPVSVSSVRVVAAGDNLLTDSLIGSGRYNSGQWNYDHLYTHVSPLIQAADIAVVSQETPFTDNHDEVSGSYPYLSPLEAGDALVNAGFDVVSLSTEYMAAAGTSYLAETMEYWNSQPGILPVGISSSGTGPDIRYTQVNDIRLAFIDCCMPIRERTIELDAGSGYEPDVFEANKLRDAVALAKEESDCVILCAHWGRSQEPMPTEYEKEWAQLLLSTGVDVILGSFPRVLSPYVTLLDEKGNSTLVYYSLGGFVSTGDTLKQLLSGLASFTIRKTTDARGTSVEIVDPDLTPLVMHYDYDNAEYGVYPLSEYTESLAGRHSVISYYGEDFSVERLEKKMDEILSMQVEPSQKNSQLSAVFDSEGNMYTSDGEYMEDTDSVTSGQYYETH